MVHSIILRVSGLHHFIPPMGPVNSILGLHTICMDIIPCLLFQLSRLLLKTISWVRQGINLPRESVGQEREREIMILSFDMRTAKKGVYAVKSFRQRLAGVNIRWLLGKIQKCFHSSFLWFIMTFQVIGRFIQSNLTDSRKVRDHLRQEKFDKFDFCPLMSIHSSNKSKSLGDQ